MIEPPLIQIRNLRFRYQGSNRDVLRIPGLDVSGHGITAITGPSGVGKSTLIELLAGTLRGPYEGSLVVLGQEWKDLTSDGQRQRQIRRIGFIPQDYGLLTDRTPVDMLQQDLSDAGVRREDRQARITAALTAMQLQDCYGRLIGTMSGGQRQRVAIARMLARDVDLVIADEPTANLDPELTESAMSILRDLSHRIPVLVITHDPAVAASCDRTILLQSTAPETNDEPSSDDTSHRHRRTALVAVLTVLALVAAGGAALAAPHWQHHKSLKPTAASSTAPATPAVPPTAHHISRPSGHKKTTPQVAEPSSGPIDDGASSVQVVDAYYTAINAQDWQKVWQLGGDNLGESYASMVRGYANTSNDVPFLTSIEGSHVQLLLLAYETSGVGQLYKGDLTIRDGAIVAAEQRLDYTDSNESFSSLTGPWIGHDRDLQITPGGLGVMSFRTFNNCGSLAAGCDEFVGNEIVNGGLIVFQLDGGQGDEAYGHVVSSTIATPGKLTMSENAARDTLDFSVLQDAPFCGPSAAQNECGA